MSIDEADCFRAFILFAAVDERARATSRLFLQ